MRDILNSVYNEMSHLDNNIILVERLSFIQGLLILVQKNLKDSESYIWRVPFTVSGSCLQTGGEKQQNMQKNKKESWFVVQTLKKLENYKGNQLKI